MRGKTPRGGIGSKKKQKVAKKLFLSASSLKDAGILKEKGAVKYLPLKLLRILTQVSTNYPIQKTSLVHFFAILKHLNDGKLGLREKRALKQNLFKPFIQNWEENREEAINRFLISTLLVRLLLDARELGGRVKAFLLTTLPKGADREVRHLLGKPFYSKLLQNIKEDVQDLGKKRERVQRELYTLFSSLAEWMEKERLSQLKELFSLFSVLEGHHSKKQREIRKDISFSFLVENFLRVVWKIKINPEKQHYQKKIDALRSFKQMLEEASQKDTNELISAQPREFSVLSSIMAQTATLRKRIEEHLKKYIPTVDGYLTLRERVELSSRQKMKKIRELLFGNAEEKTLLERTNENQEASLFNGQSLSKINNVRSKAIQLQKENEEEFKRGTALPNEVKNEISTLYDELLGVLKTRSEKVLEEFENFINLSFLLNACFFNNLRDIKRYIGSLSNLDSIFLD